LPLFTDGMIFFRSEKKKELKKTFCVKTNKTKVIQVKTLFYLVQDEKEMKQIIENGFTCQESDDTIKNILG
jgi:hypothetical protein